MGSVNNIYLPCSECCHHPNFLAVLSLPVFERIIILLQIRVEGELVTCSEDWSLWVIRQWSQLWWDLLASAEQRNMLTQAAEKLVMTALKLKKIQWIVYSGREAFLCVRVALFGSSAALAFLCQMVLTGLLSNSGVWHLVYCYGNEILQLQKGDARDNCGCQVTTCPLSLSVLLNEHFIYLWIILF